jgi:flagellar hook-associated protein 2
MTSGVGSTSSGATNRIGGIESGLDTDSIVEGLIAGDKNKITAATRQKQLLTWKRDSYRDVITKLTTFNKKYFSSSSYFADMLGKNSATNSGANYVTATPSTSAIKNNIVIGDIVSLASSSKLESSSPVSKSADIAINLSLTDNLAGKSLKVTLDGVEKSITFSATPYTTVDAVKTELQSLLNQAFGENIISVSQNADTVTLNSPGNTIVLGKGDVPENDASTILTFQDGIENRIKITDKLSNISLKTSQTYPVKFFINGKEFNFTESNTMRDVVSTVNSSDAGVTMNYSGLTDTFTLTSNQTGAGKPITLLDDTGTFLNSIFGAGNFTDGTNAEIKINTNAGSADPSSLTYTTVIKSSNTFDIDGVSYSLLGKASGAALENVAINVSYDIDYAATKVKEFIVEYNDLLKLVTDKTSEQIHKGFPPLSDEERKALGPADAALYDVKAKSGLLKNDGLLSSIATALRNSISTDVKQLTNNDASIGISTVDLGIKTGAYSEKGQLHIDETKLRKALAEKPDQVINLFTQKSSVEYSTTMTTENVIKRNKESGVMNRISDILQNNIKSTTGALIKLVGTQNNDYTTFYSSRLRNIEDKITKLNETLEKNRDRYWANFTRMEKALSEMNKKGAWLSQQLGSSQ